MEVLQQIDPNLAIWLTIGCGLLCVVAIILAFLLQFIGLGLELIFHTMEFVGGIIAGGPMAWCGCLVFLGGCGFCGLMTWVIAVIIPQCGTPEALNLCRLLGY